MASLLKNNTLTISSPSFIHQGSIPKKFTCQGENVNPALTVDNIPTGTKSLALIMDDPDAPGRTFDQWIVWNIQPNQIIAENSIPGTEGRNHFGFQHYKGPCPPSGTHRYFFKVYALDALLNLKTGAEKGTVEKTMHHHILASGELVGLYEKT